MSVLLPTVEWGTACTELAEQLEPSGELLLICDTEADPIAGRETPPNTEVLAAGVPTRGSGKANAFAHGMERAKHDRFVRTDEDFTHSPDCLDRFVDAEQKHGPATVIPNFVGDEWWRLVEPTSTVVSTLSMYLGRGPWAGDAWDGGVIFTRDDVYVAELMADFRQCLSDDGVLSDHPGTVYPIRAMIADVVVPGDFASVKERMTRFTRVTHVHEGLGGPLVTSLLFAVLALFFPLYSIPLITVASGVT